MTAREIAEMAKGKDRISTDMLEDYIWQYGQEQYGKGYDDGNRDGHEEALMEQEA